MPENFRSLPLLKQNEILNWVQRTVQSGNTEFRRFLTGTLKDPYALRLIRPAHTHPSREDVKSEIITPDINRKDVEPQYANAKLRAEIQDLLQFKMSVLTPLGMRREGVWGRQTAIKTVKSILKMLGALASKPDSPALGYGVPSEDLSLGVLIFPSVWDWYIHWRLRRRGFFTQYEIDVLFNGHHLISRNTGWLRQNPQVLDGLRPIAGLITQQEIDNARQDWNGFCDSSSGQVVGRAKDIRRVARVHRDSFEAILPVLEAESPVGEYRKITEEILRRMPDEERHPRKCAEAVRSFLLLRFGLHLGLRQRNLRELRICLRGCDHTPDRQLREMKCGELRWNSKVNGWEVFIPFVAFKNSLSPFFAKNDFRHVLPDLQDLYPYIDSYLERHRPVLMSGADDSGTFFVKTMRTNSIGASYCTTTFYLAWRQIIERYGIYNPYTGRGAIKGLLPHGPHCVRDVLATHILKRTGSFEKAGYAIQDTPEVVAKYYGRFIPSQKTAIAAQILNEAWD